MLKDLAGKKFGNLKALYPYRGTVRTYWMCECSCGWRGGIARYRLTGKFNIRGCPVCAHTNRTPQFTGVITRYKRQAKGRNIEWKLSTEDAVKLFLSNCSYCGVEPSNAFHRSKDRFYSGIDRIDCKKGYIKTNCVPACAKCNRAKGSYSVAQFHAWIVSVYERSIVDR
jgi:hypothetical protein